MVEVLKPCPFCGGNAKWEMYHIVCTRCKGSMGFDASQDSPVHTLASWNTRTNPELTTLKARVRGWKSRLSNNFRHDTCCPDDCWSHIFSVIDEMREVTG